MDDDKIKLRIRTTYTEVVDEQISLKPEYTKDEFLDMMRAKKLQFDGLWYYFNETDPGTWIVARVAVARVDGYKCNKKTVIEETKNEVEITNG